MDTFSTEKGSVTGAYPDSIEISAVGPVPTQEVVIDPAGDIAGVYLDRTDFRQRGFLLAPDGTETRIDGPPGSLYLNVIGIDDAGEVIGSYEDAALVNHGFVYRNGTLATVDPPGSTSTDVEAVDESGNFSGVYQDALGRHGFVDQGGAVTTFDLPAGETFSLSGGQVVNASGEVAGTATSSNSEEPGNDLYTFRPGDAAPTVVELPGSVSAVKGISATGTVVGTTSDGPGSFIYKTGGTPTALTVQNSANDTVANSVSVVGIDEAGDIAGTYYDEPLQRTRGFVMSPTGVTRVFDATPADASSTVVTTTVTAITPSGTVLGSYQTSDGVTHAFDGQAAALEAGGATTSLPAPAGSSFVAPTGMDTAGDVVGSYYATILYGLDTEGSFVDRSGSGASTPIAIQAQLDPRIDFIAPSGNLIGTVADDDGDHVFVDRGGTFTLFDPPTPTGSLDVVGTDDAGDAFANYDVLGTDGSDVHRAFIEKSGVVTDYEATPDAVGTRIQAVDAAGDFAGTFDTGQSTSIFVSRAGQTTVVTGGLPMNSDQGGLLDVEVAAINAAGTVAGTYQYFSQSTKTLYDRAFVVTAGSDQAATVDVNGSNYVFVEGIDAASDLYGRYLNGEDESVGFVQTAEGKRTDYFGPDDASSTAVVGIDAGGDVFGTYSTYNNESSFLFVQKAGTTTPIRIASAASDLYDDFVGVDAAGDVAGNYTDSAGKSHGFIYLTATGAFSTVDGAPGATSTTIDGIDAAGDVFGRYMDSAGARHSFVSFVADMPTLAGTHTTATAAEAPVAPFAGVTVGDANAGATDTLTIALAGGGGTLRDGAGYAGLQKDPDGSYRLAGTAAAVTAELDALVFTPAAGAPGVAVSTTFTLTDVTSAGGSNTDTVTDSGTVVIDTAAPGGTAPGQPGTPGTPGQPGTPQPGNPGQPGSPGQPGASSTVSFDDQVFYGGGAFTLTGAVSSPAGISAVEITAAVDGVATDLGAATVNRDGTFTFSDAIGHHTQGFITATATGGAGGTASAVARYALQGGLAGAYPARQDRYSADGSAVTATDRFTAGGAQTASLFAPGGETFASAAFDTFNNGGAPLETFVFAPGAGRETVDGFRVDGVDHDTLSLKGTDFGDDVAAVLNSSRDVKGGLLITDPTASSPGPGGHDTIFLSGVSKARLAQNTGDIAFQG